MASANAPAPSRDPDSVLADTAVAVRPDVETPHGTDLVQGVEAEGGAGLPQLEMEHWGGQIAWLLLIFIVLYVLFARVFLPRLRAVQDQRSGAIAGAIEQARLVQTEAEEQAASAKAELDDARATARATAAAARARVAEDANRRQAEDEARVNARIAEAEGRIAQGRDAAMAKVSGIAADTTAAMVERLTGEKPTAAQVQTALKGA